MTYSADPGAAVRMSALADVHARLAHGATGPDRRWPMSYGDPEAEREAAAAAIGLAEPGLYDKLMVRGPGALAAIRALNLVATAGRVTPAPLGGINVWTIADDEVLLVAYAPMAGGPTATPVDFGRMGSSLRRAGLAATDVSSGWAVLRLVGPGSRDLLAELVSTDLAADVVPDLAILQVTMAACRVILSRRDNAAVPGFTFLVARDEAEYLWETLTELGHAYGIRPIGASALLAPPLAAATGVSR